ncbi:ParA family protein [Paenibacillus alkaliterrae]|uniref:ParA family protein n=1 Tax=Paenibacillus alkaliterrae TaxID=320909 RepID=UPI001F304EA1|nr:ParA family protein [Paenibacillus alkaliterrae]MCF2939948.1 ParA family protein [Paenibacillus alkaliterrae]
MKIISISNNKGGVGKTTLTVNLAFELIRRGYVVLLVDLDDQCDLTKIYRPPGDVTPDILSLLQGRCAITDAHVEVADNLHLVPGSSDLFHFGFTQNERILLELFSDKEFEDVDFVLIDHPPNLNEAALVGYTASDEVLIVTDPEAFGVQNLDQMFDRLEQIKDAMNPSLHILGIVVNKVDLRRNLTSKMLKDLSSVLGDTLFSTWNSNDTAIPTSLYAGKPVRTLHWRSRTVDQFSKITEELLERMGYLNGYGETAAE